MFGTLMTVFDKQLISFTLKCAETLEKFSNSRKHRFYVSKGEYSNKIFFTQINQKFMTEGDSLLKNASNMFFFPQTKDTLCMTLDSMTWKSSNKTFLFLKHL